MVIASSPLLKMPLPMSSRSLKPSPFYPTAQFPPSTTPATAMVSSSAGPFHSRSRDLLSISFSGSFPLLSSVAVSSTRPLASISSSAAALSGSGGGGDGLPGGAGGGGGDGGSSGRDAARKPLVGETEVDPALGSDSILLSVGGMTCGGCAASVKRILESQPQVASATVDLEKEIAVVWPVPEAKDAENWQQQLGEKLANHLTTCGFKSIFQGEEQAIGQEI